MSDSSETIVFVLPRYEGGGAERVVIKVACELKRKGRHVLLVGLLEDAPCSHFGLPSVGLGASRVAFATIPLLQLFRSLRPFAVVSTLKHVSAMVAWVHILSGCSFRHVVRVANTYSRELRGFGKGKAALWSIMLRQVHRLAHRTICVSQGVQRDLQANFAISGERCVYIPNPVDLDGLHAAAEQVANREMLRYGADKVILSVGRLTPQKNYLCLIDAFDRLCRQIETNCILVIIGEGAERARLEAEIHQRDLANRVKLLGWVANPYPYYAAADVFALSSDFEGMPNVILEALTFDLPVVSTDCESGPREILTSSDLGILVPVGDAHALASGLAQALDGVRIGRRPEHVRQHYDLATISTAYDRVILAV